MHPLYINDLITKTKEDLRFSTANMRLCINELKAPHSDLQNSTLEWLMKEVEVNTHLLQHSLHQLNKHLEANASKSI